MKGNCTQYKIDIFGAQYTLKSDESADHIAQTASLVDSLMKSIAVHKVGIDTEKVAVLAALQLASQLVSLEQEKVNIIDTVDRALNAYSR